MQKNSIINFTISSDPIRFLSRVILFTIFSLFSLLIFREFNSPNVDPMKIKLTRALAPLLWLVTVHSWYQYFQVKKYKLIITDHKVAWGSKSKATSINWSKVHTLRIIDLTEISLQSGLLYEFTTKNNKTNFEKPLTLYGEDYLITHQKLTDIFQSKAKQHNFRLKL